MSDIVSPQKRSHIMSMIRSKDTKPEMAVRKWLHSRGFRYRLHGKKLPGTPDIVLPKWKTVIFVNGCFFHHHEDCKIAYIPKSRTEWWLEKFQKNKERDLKATQELQALGWQVLIIWECQVRDGSYHDILQNYFQEKIHVRIDYRK